MKPSRAQLVLLAVLSEAPRSPSRTELVKWVFLLTQETSVGSLPGMYEFVPYRYGPFSFTMYKDLHKLRALGYVAQETLALTHRGRQVVADNLASLPGQAHVELMSAVRRAARLRRGALLRYVYERHPYFASKSELAGRPHDGADTAVFTCGYQGSSLEAFFNKIIRAGISQILDVRHSTWSRRYGFTEKVFPRVSLRLDIQYDHVPQLGVPPDLRQNLRTEEQYEKLFRDYEMTIASQQQLVEQLASTMANVPSVLICYEADPDCCHRSRLAEKLASINELEIVHL